MANTFKVKTKASVSNSSLDTIYTVPSSTSTVVLGMALSNKTTSAITADVQLVSNTSDTETNADVFLLKGVDIPANTHLRCLEDKKLSCKLLMLLKHKQVPQRH